MHVQRGESRRRLAHDRAHVPLAVPLVGLPGAPVLAKATYKLLVEVAAG